jgi:DNA-binding PadR family transcriptional regulator
MSLRTDAATPYQPPEPDISPTPVPAPSTPISVLDLAVLGLLHEAPLHGYEIKKRLNASLGALRAFSYGSLYPCLRRLQRGGLIAVDDSAAATTLSGRSKVVYTLTADGKDRFAEMLGDAGPAAWEDDAFGVHLRFFGQTPAPARLRILEGRRSRVEERQEGLRADLARTRSRLDSYTLKLQEHGLDSVEREVRWLGELIDSEREALRDADRPDRHGSTGVTTA